MKKIIFGAVIALGVISCGETTPEVTVDSKAVLEMEAVTDAVSEGTEKLNAEVEALDEEMNELLNEL